MARFLLTFLTGCHSTQGNYLGQAIDHATPMEFEQALMHSSPGQVLDTGQRLRLYCRDGIPVMVKVRASSFSVRTECGVEVVPPLCLYPDLISRSLGSLQIMEGAHDGGIRKAPVSG